MSFHFGSLLDWSLYCLHFLFLFLLFLHADALVFIFSALLLASLSSFFWPRALAFVRPVLLSALVSRLSPAPWLVSGRCSVSNGSAPMRLVGISSLEGFFLRYCHAQSRHDSGVGACLVESGLYLSILVDLLGLVVIVSPSLACISPCSCFYFLGHSFV